MINSKKRRLRPAFIQEDRNAYAALKAIEGYNPSNPDYKLTEVDKVFTTMNAEQTLEVQHDAAADAQRDKTVNSEWTTHDTMRGVKMQVKAQYGEDSDEYASLGMKKKSEYKTGKSVKKPTGTT